MAADGDRAIRYRWLAASPWEAHLFLAAEFEHTVHVCSLEHGTRLTSFDSVFEPGGSRLAIVTAGQPLVVAGAWTRHGATCSAIASIRSPPRWTPPAPLLCTRDDDEDGDKIIGNGKKPG